MSGGSTGIMMCSLPETSSDDGGGGDRRPSEEFETAQETLFLCSQEPTVNLSGRVVNDHYKELNASVDVSTEYVKTVDLGKDSDPRFSQVNSLSDKSFSPSKEFFSSFVRQKTSSEILDLQSMRVDDAAEQSRDSTLGENIGLLKPTFGEIISLKCGGVTGEIAVVKSKEESPAEKRKQSKDYQIGVVNAAHGISTSLLKPMDEDPEMDIPKETVGHSNEERGSSKKNSKGQLMLETPLEEFQTAEETLQINPQEQMMNSPNRVVEDHHSDVSTEHIETVDLRKDSGDPGFWGGCVDNVAKRIEDSALGKTRRLFKQKTEESVGLQCGGPAGEITVGYSMEESLAEKRKQSEDYQFGTGNPPGVSTSPLKAMDKDPEIGISRYREICSNVERGSSKKTSKGQSTCENASEDAKGWCELPASIQGLMQSAAKHLVLDDSSSENQSLESLMDAIFGLSGENNATTDLRNDDILETVKQRGMKFPQPRWWPPEGF